MKKFLAVLLVLGLMAGCAGPKEVEKPEQENVSYKILAPKGAPALALAQVMNGEREDVYTLVDGSDVLATELAKADSEYDIIVAPINLGAKLITSGKSEYRLASVLTWGNLYVVGTPEATEEEEIAAFGEAAVPGMVFKTITSKLEMNNEVSYYPSVTEAQAQLLSGKVNLALIAEPAVTATIAKAKQDGKELVVKMDLQQKWEEIYGSYGYPQAAIFVKKSVHEENKDALLEYLENVALSIKDGNTESFGAAVEAIGAEELGVPNVQVATKSYERQNINYVNAASKKEAIQDFLNVFGITANDDLYLY